MMSEWRHKSRWSPLLRELFVGTSDEAYYSEGDTEDLILIVDWEEDSRTWTASVYTEEDLIQQQEGFNILVRAWQWAEAFAGGWRERGKKEKKA